MSQPELTPADFDRIAHLMVAATGMAFNAAKRPLVASRLAPRLLKLGLKDYGDYVAVLEADHQAAEFQTAVDLLTTNETYFFREPKHFALLEATLLARRDKSPVQVWSAAASFGDEAYSAAMLLADLQLAGRISPDWSVLATDISHRVLHTAKEGVYPDVRLREVSPERLRRYCLRGEGPSEGLIRLRDTLRERVQFGRINLSRPIEALGPFDVIFLRNVLIYFDVATKVQVMDRVLDTLRPGGLFFLGTAEGRIACNTPLETLQAGAFRKPA